MTGPTLPCFKCRTPISEERAAVADSLCEACGEPAGWKTWYLIDSKWYTNAVVWPDRESADLEGADRLMRWLVPVGHEARPTDEPPNRPTLAEYRKER